MGGYQASFQFNLTDMLQAQGDHIAACIDHVRRHGHRDDRRARRRPRSGGCRRSSPIAARPTATHECTPGYYNFEGEFNRRQDGNYNGGFPKYYAHLAAVREQIEQHFEFTP